MTCLCAGTLAAKTYFVAPDGKDTNSGTIDSPFATLNKAYSFDDADTIYFRAGTYKIQESQITEVKSPYARVFVMSKKTGTKDKRTYIGGYKDERPVFDLSEVRPEGLRVCVFYVNGSYHHFNNFEIIGTQVTITGHTQSECFRNEGGNNNLYENLAMHDGMAIGFYLTKGMNNLVLNCDAYNNYDDFSEGAKGGNVDGFGGHPDKYTSTGNVFRGCRAWWNSDDGFDLINASAQVVIDNCWSFYNGYQTGTFESAGDGTGFKAGGYGMSENPKAPEVIPMHVVTNCLAYYNKNKGFYSNHHLGGILWANNTGYMNPSNYCMLNRKSAEETVDVGGYGHILWNNVSYGPRSTGADIVDTDRTKCILANNSFQTVPGISEADFQSLDAELLMSPRQADGSLPEIAFLRPQESSLLAKSGMGYTFRHDIQEDTMMYGETYAVYEEGLLRIMGPGKSKYTKLSINGEESNLNGGQADLSSYKGELEIRVLADDGSSISLTVNNQ